MAKAGKQVSTHGDEDLVAPPRRHEAYAQLPAPQRIGEQLRELQASADAFERQLAHILGCNPTDLAAMQILIDDGPQSPSALASRLGITTAAATHVVDRLTTLGHATRAEHEHDRRRVVVVPAQASIAAAVKELRPIIFGVAAIVNSLSAHDRRVVEQFLDDVNDCYRATLRNANDQ